MASLSKSKCVSKSEIQIRLHTVIFMGIFIPRITQSSRRGNTWFSVPKIKQPLDIIFEGSIPSTILFDCVCSYWIKTEYDDTCCCLLNPASVFFFFLGIWWIWAALNLSVICWLWWSPRSFWWLWMVWRTFSDWAIRRPNRTAAALTLTAV